MPPRARWGENQMRGSDAPTKLSGKLTRARLDIATLVAVTLSIAGVIARDYRLTLGPRGVATADRMWTLLISLVSLSLMVASVVTWCCSLLLYRRADAEERHLLLLANIVLIAFCAMCQVIQV